ncbi:hypothetical protein Tco_0615273 [Tanacetum coccineum]
MSSREMTEPIPTPNVAAIEARGHVTMENPETKKSSSSASMEKSPGDTYQPGWGILNKCRLDTPDACKELVDHIAPLGYFSVLRHLPNDDLLNQYNMNLAREEEIKNLDQEIASLRFVEVEVQGLRHQSKNVETLLEAEADIRKTMKAKYAELAKELESLRVQHKSPEKKKIKAAFEEFKKLEDQKVESRCAKMDAQIDAMSINFDKELYPNMLTAIAGRRWVIEHGLRLAVMKCAESIELRQAFADMVEAYDPEADSKFTKALSDVKELRYPLVDELEKLKDAPLEVRDPQDPWAFKEEMPLQEAIAANISRAEKKKKCWVVCRTHGVGSAHHARSDGVPVSVPTVIPQGQTEADSEKD